MRGAAEAMGQEAAARRMEQRRQAHEVHVKRFIRDKSIYIYIDIDIVFVGTIYSKRSARGN